MSTLHFNVAGDPTDDQPTLLTDNPPGGTQLASAFSGLPGQVPNRWSVICPAAYSGGATVTYDHGRQTFRVILPPGEGDWEAGQPPCLPPEYAGDPQQVALIYRSVPTLLPLHAAGQFFATSDGQPVTVIGCSDFALWQQYTQGTDIGPVVKQRKAFGFTQLRVFGMYHGGLGHFDPRPTISTLRSFCQLLGETYGMRVELTVFADTPAILPNPADQRAWWNQVCGAVDGLPYVTLEGVNEGDHPLNKTVALPTLPTPAGTVCSRGSGIQEGAVMLPVMTYATYHPTRGSEWQRKVGHNAMEDVANPYRLPVVSNECCRPDEDGFQPRHFSDAAAGAALLCAGATFHSQSGKASQGFTDPEALCADAWVAGARSVDLTIAHPGRYVRRDDLLTPGLLRVYEKRLGDRSVIVEIRV